MLETNLRVIQIIYPVDLFLYLICGRHSTKPHQHYVCRHLLTRINFYARYLVFPVDFNDLMIKIKGNAMLFVELLESLTNFLTQHFFKRHPWSKDCDRSSLTSL